MIQFGNFYIVAKLFFVLGSKHSSTSKNKKMAENTSAQQLPHAGAYHHAAGVPQGKMNEEWTPAAYAEYYNNVLEPYYQNLVYAQHPMAYSPAYMMGHHPMAYYYPAAYMLRKYVLWELKFCSKAKPDCKSKAKTKGKKEI